MIAPGNRSKKSEGYSQSKGTGQSLVIKGGGWMKKGGKGRFPSDPKPIGQQSSMDMIKHGMSQGKNPGGSGRGLVRQVIKSAIMYFIFGSPYSGGGGGAASAAASAGSGVLKSAAGQAGSKASSVAGKIATAAGKPAPALGSLPATPAYPGSGVLKSAAGQAPAPATGSPPQGLLSEFTKGSNASFLDKFSALRNLPYDALSKWTGLPEEAFSGSTNPGQALLKKYTGVDASPGGLMKKIGDLTGVPGEYTDTLSELVSRRDPDRKYGRGQTAEEIMPLGSVKPIQYIGGFAGGTVQRGRRKRPGQREPYTVRETVGGAGNDSETVQMQVSPNEVIHVEPAPEGWTTTETPWTVPYAQEDPHASRTGYEHHAPDPRRTAGKGGTAVGDFWVPRDHKPEWYEHLNAAVGLVGSKFSSDYGARLTAGSERRERQDARKSIRDIYTTAALEGRDLSHAEKMAVTGVRDAIGMQGEHLLGPPKSRVSILDQGPTGITSNQLEDWNRGTGEYEPSGQPFKTGFPTLPNTTMISRTGPKGELETAVGNLDPETGEYIFRDESGNPVDEKNAAFYSKDDTSTTGGRGGADLSASDQNKALLRDSKSLAEILEKNPTLGAKWGTGMDLGTTNNNMLVGLINNLVRASNHVRFRGAEGGSAPGLTKDEVDLINKVHRDAISLSNTKMFNVLNPKVR